MIAGLSDVLTPALRGGYAVAGVVCLGWEDARAYTRAAEAEDLPLILQVGPGARGHMPLSVWGSMLRNLADAASVPVVVHLDHGRTLNEVRDALNAGFSSVMIDGSALPLAENIALTRQAVELAAAQGADCEGELGFVGYAEGAASQGTDPTEAARFVAETGVAALAVSVGNVHLQTEAAAQIDRAHLAAIEAATDVPLVIHGGSGVPPEVRRDLALTSSVCKFNIGTELRQTFGTALRDAVAGDEFDRIKLLSAVEQPLTETARAVLANLHPTSQEARNAV